MAEAIAEPKPAWLTPREPGTGGDTLKMAGLDLSGQGTLAAPSAPKVPPLSRRVLAQLRGDVAPGVRPAGKAGEIAVVQSARSPGEAPRVIVETPRTPENLGHIQRRHRLHGGPGESCLPWATRELQIPPPGPGYGRKNAKDDDVAQNFRAGQLFGVAEYQVSCRERIYQSTTREPLGKSYERGIKPPAQSLRPDFPGFGVPTQRNDHGAKDSLFPRGVKPDTQEIKDQYKRTHGDGEPGEMTDRKYKWPEAIKRNPLFSFGLSDPFADATGRGIGVKTALTLNAVDEPLAVPKTVLMKRTQVAATEVRHDHLGKPRNLLQGPGYLNTGRTFGIKTTSEDTSAGALIRGFYTAEQQQPDPDLGKCLMPGRRNLMTERRLGVPTVRLDIVAPPVHKRSVANHTNFGDDAHAGDLLYPGRFLDLGVTAEDLQDAITKHADLYDDFLKNLKKPQYGTA